MDKIVDKITSIGFELMRSSSYTISELKYIIYLYTYSRDGLLYDIEIIEFIPIKDRKYYYTLVSYDKLGNPTHLESNSDDDPEFESIIDSQFKIELREFNINEVTGNE